MIARVGLLLAPLLLAAGTAEAQEPIKIGSSVGLAGYAAATDRSWRDGLELAAAQANAKGGWLGRKIELLFEDNRSEPQEAVVGYRKLVSSDKVDAVDSGCVSAGNAAAASSLVRAKVPMILCSILPPRPEEQKWAFSFLAPPRFEIEARLQYLKDKTGIRKIGILHDPTPYALLMKGLAPKIAEDFGMEIVATESYKQDDSDMSVQIGRINAGGAGAIIKMGQGGSTVTAAKNIRQLGLDKLLLIASTDDGAIFTQAGQTLGDQFLFIAPAVQVPDVPMDAAKKQAIDAFLKVWRTKYQDRDSSVAARAWDSFDLLGRAIVAAKSTDGTAVRDAMETLSGIEGVFADYNFSAEQHNGITKNPFVIGVLRDGKFAAKN